MKDIRYRLTSKLAFIVIFTTTIVSIGIPSFPASGAQNPAGTSGTVCGVRSCPYKGTLKSVSFVGRTPSIQVHSNASLTSSPPSGYWLVASDGGIFSYGDATFLGSTGAMSLNNPIVGMAATPDGKGYWLVASDGGIFSYGDATFLGSTGAMSLNNPIVGMAATPDGKGYWLVASDGGIFSYGDATFLGSTGAMSLNNPIVGMAATPDGKGYWLVASDGGIFSYGDATFLGSTGAMSLNNPIVGMAATPDGKGYWLVASDGGIFSYGDATFLGSTGAMSLNNPIVGMAATPDGKGYWLVASDGGIFSYGDATFLGSTGAMSLNNPIVGMGSLTASAPTPGSSTHTRPGPLATLKVTITNLPSGTPASVQVTDPNGSVRTLTSSTTIDTAAPGHWKVVANPVTTSAYSYFPAIQTTTVTLGPGAQGAVSVAYTQVVSNSTTVVSPNAIESLGAAGTNGGQMVVVSDPSHVIVPGSTIVAGAGPSDPNGVLLDVTGVTSASGTDTVTGNQGSLTDIGPEADITMNTTPGPTTSLQLATSHRAQIRSQSDGQSFDSPLSCSGTVGASISGSVHFSPALHLDIHWGGLLSPGTFTAEATMSGTETADLAATVGAQASCTLTEEIPPSPIILGVIDIQIGPVPVVITPQLDFQLKASGSVKGKLQSSVSQSLTATAGLDWNGSSLSPVTSLSNSFTFTPFTPSFSGNLHAQVGPQLSFDLYGVAGPYISADAFSDLTVNPASSPWWKLSGGIEAGGGIELHIFGIHFNEGIPNILSKTWTIAHATTSPPLTITTINLFKAYQGSAYNDILHAAGGSPPYNWSISSGSLPTGLHLSSSGAISGVPTNSGTSSFIAAVTDQGGGMARQSYTMPVASSGGGGSGANPHVLSLAGDGWGYCAVLYTGGVDCWGWNIHGLLGHGVSTATLWFSDIPVSVIGITNAISVSNGAGAFCAVLSTGGVDCWGQNVDGALGNGFSDNPATIVGSDIPGAVVGITDAVSLSRSGGYGFCAILATGGVDCWGQNVDGALGNGVSTATLPYSDVPVEVTGISDAVTLLTARTGACAVLATGGVDCWGQNVDGALGSGVSTATLPYSDVPVEVKGISDAVNLATSFGTSCVVLSTGGVDCWGNNGAGILGNGVTATKLPFSDVPVAVFGITDAQSVAITATGSFYAVLKNGAMVSWGSDSYGDLGAGIMPTDTSGASTPHGGFDAPVSVSGISDAFSTSNEMTDVPCVVLSTGGVDCWGENSYGGGLGEGAKPTALYYSDVPVQVTGISNALSIAAGGWSTCAILSTGGVACWGSNTDGELGIGNNPYTTPYSDVPVTVVGFGS